MSVSINKYNISISADQLRSLYGYNPAFGSSLHFTGSTEDGKLKFLAITDRGPNAQHEIYYDAIVYFNPNFAITIAEVIVDVENNSCYVDKFLEVKKDGKRVSGVNPNFYVLDERTISPENKQIKVTFGLDTEAIAVTSDGKYVIAEEFIPAILVVNPLNGEIEQEQIFTPGDVLPEVLKHRNCNRGFEALTVAPNGKIYAIMEGALAFDEATTHNSKLFRMIELDLVNKTTKTFAYGFNYTLYADSLNVKVGDMAAIDNENFLVVEQGKALDNKFYNLIYRISINNVTDISQIKLPAGKEFEHLSLEELSNIVFVNKTLVFNPREFGWKEKKLEGLAIINNTAIAISNDNDFGVEGYTHEYENDLNIHKEILKPIIHNADTNLWLITSDEPFF